LWRVIERSDLIVQIVDARNPLLFRSEDLETYVKDVDPKKENLLLINKADMMTLAQRKAWAKHLTEAGIAYKFFSAQLAKEMIEARERDGESEDDTPQPSSRSAGKQPAGDVDSSDEESEDEGGVATGVSQNEDEDEDTQILTVEELEGIFLAHAPKDAGQSRTFRHPIHKRPLC
jgi:large subunit GTPase 1